MMMIAPNSVVRQWLREEEEEAGDQRKGGPIGTPTPGAYAVYTMEYRLSIRVTLKVRPQKLPAACSYEKIISHF